MRIYFILVEPAVPGNIGASARAVKTMGFKHLRLINPSDHLSLEAKMMAHASGDVLLNAEVFRDLHGALADLDMSIATTAKIRDARVDYFLNSDLPAMIRSKGKTIEKLGIVFGREEYGLSNDEIRMCDLASTIPLNQPYPSLNLSQAVMIYAYSLADLASAANEVKPRGKKEKKRSLPASGPGQFRAMMDQSGDLLKKLAVDRSPALYNRILERLALMEEDDIHLLLSVLSRLQDQA